MGKCLEFLAFCADQFQKGTNILLVKGTSHTGMIESRMRTTMITSASSEVGSLKKFDSRKKKKKQK